MPVVFRFKVKSAPCFTAGLSVSGPATQRVWWGIFLLCKESPTGCWACVWEKFFTSFFMFEKRTKLSVAMPFEFHIPFHRSLGFLRVKEKKVAVFKNSEIAGSPDTRKRSMLTQVPSCNDNEQPGLPTLGHIRSQYPGSLQITLQTPGPRMPTTYW